MKEKVIKKNFIFALAAVADPVFPHGDDSGTAALKALVLERKATKKNFIFALAATADPAFPHGDGSGTAPFKTLSLKEKQSKRTLFSLWQPLLIPHFHTVTAPGHTQISYG